MFLLLGKIIRPLYPDKDTLAMLYQRSVSCQIYCIISVGVDTFEQDDATHILEISLKVLICNFLFLTNTYNFPQRTLIFCLVI